MIFGFLVVRIRELFLEFIAVGRIEFHGRRYVEGGLLSFCVLGDDAAWGLLSFYVLGDTAAGGLLRNPCLDV